MGCSACAASSAVKTNFTPLKIVKIPRPMGGQSNHGNIRVKVRKGAQGGLPMFLNPGR